MTEHDPQLERLVAEVLNSAKYRQISPELIRAFGTHELTVRATLREAVKETKSRLHQVAGAFLDRTPHYQQWRADLQAACGDPEALRQACRKIMAGHASTRERLAELDHFYQAIFAALPPVGSLLDTACGLNPLAAPWMPLPSGSPYLACDLYADMCAFVAAGLELLGYAGRAAVWDLSAGAPPWQADVALVLKTLPVLEHARRGAGHALLRGLQASNLVVSFPTRSLSGRNVGMAATYTNQLQAIAETEGWSYETLTFSNELVFVVAK